MLHRAHRIASRLVIFTTLASAAGCVTSGGDGDPLDGLPPYAGDTGGGSGKADDGTCTDDSYRAFVTEYQATTAALAAPVTDAALATATAAAASNPCQAGNDASFRIWSYLLGQTLQPALDRDGALTDRERADLRYLALVRPASTGLVGAAAWDDVYGKALAAAAAPIAGGDAARVVSSAEDEWLGVVEAARPTVNEAGAWQPWWGTVQGFVDQLTVDASAHPDGLGAADAAFLDRLARAVPRTSFDADAAAASTTVLKPVVDALVVQGLNPSTTATDAARLTRYPTLVSAGGGPLAYAAWATSVETMLSAGQPGDGIVGLVHTPLIAPMVAAVVAARPCADPAAVADRVTALQQLASFVDADHAIVNGAPLTSQLAPTACTP